MDHEVTQLESPNEIADGENDLDLVSVPISDLKGNNEKSATGNVGNLEISSIKNTTSDVQARSDMKMQHLYNLELSQISQATSHNAVT